MIQCKQCGKELEKELEDKFVAFDVQKIEKENFCSLEHLKSWRTQKITGMCTALLLGLIMVVIALVASDLRPLAIFFFLPYMIRQASHSFANFFSGGGFGSFITFFLVLIGSITFIYPIYKLYQEIAEYARLKKVYPL
ncbi:MAG: hypothetical protein J1E06_11275 [Acutalibacter sp.]|nr:hypothetical protein [Acutalibacter sp.]